MSETYVSAHQLVDVLFGVPDQAAIRAVAVLHAQAAALSWVAETTGDGHASPTVAARLQAVAMELRSDERDPSAGLIGEAVTALAAERTAAA
jgi:hypothetical protein